MPSARGALIFATFPLMTMLLATVLGKKTLNRFKIAGVTAKIVGVGLILDEKALEAGSESCASVLYRPYLQRYPPLAVCAFAMFASVLFLAGLAGAEGFPAPLHAGRLVRRRLRRGFVHGRVQGLKVCHRHTDIADVPIGQNIVCGTGLLCSIEKKPQLIARDIEPYIGRLIVIGPSL